jgi:tetratricopeptide (TPR) repeat protein
MLLIGPALFVLALAVYLATLSPGAFPGESASIISSHTGLDPFLPLTHFLWGTLARFLAALPVSTLALKLNVFSALCGALAVWLMYAVTSRLKHDRTFEEHMARFDAPAAQAFSGVVAALFLMVCLPIWVTSTRAHTLSFDLLLLLAVTFLLFQYASGRKPWQAYLFVLVYALGATEFETMIPLGPLFAVVFIFELWQAKQLRVPFVLRLTGIFLVGLAPYFIGAWRFTLSPAYAWRSFENYFDVLWQTWREQYFLLTGGFPKIGWLMILFTTILPWMFLVLKTPGMTAGRKNTWGGSYILCAVLTGLAGALLFNSAVAPWNMTGMSTMMVTPVAFAAMWSGYLGGYWLVMLIRRNRGERPFAVSLRRVVRWIYVVTVLAVFGAAAWNNLPAADGRHGRLVNDFAGEVLDNLQGREWLITNGAIDKNLAIIAHDRGLAVKLIDMTYDRSKAYRKYVASLFSDPRLKTLAYIGLYPMVNEWIAEHPDTVGNVAVLTAPDFWYAGPYEPKPNKILFLGCAAGVEADGAALLDEHRKFWSTFGERMRQPVPDHALAKPWIDALRTHISKVANNLGVFLENRGDKEGAYEAYGQARLMDTNNVSALLNQRSLARRESMPELNALDADIAALVKQLQSRFRIWSLASVYGYVRYPEAYAQRGWAWAMSGKPNLAISDMRRAIELGGANDSLQLALANLYFRTDQAEVSEREYLDLLGKNPDNLGALQGMARIAMQKGDFESARSYLARLEELKVSSVTLAMERAAMEALSGNPAEASKLLQEVVKVNPDKERAWAALAAISVQLNDQETLDRCLNKLQSTGRKPASTARLALAQIAISRGDTKAARKHLEELLRSAPNNIPALEMMVRLDVFEGLRDEAENHVEMLLRQDAKSALGNYVNGTLLAAREQYTLAESAFRTSLESQRTPEPLNDLAWVLVHRGAYDEALELARESLDLDDSSGSTWDTFGSALMAKGRLDEAEEAIQKALALKPDAAPIMLNMARLYEKKGMNKDALRLADSLLARPSEMSRESYDELREIVKRLRAST